MTKIADESKMPCNDAIYIKSTYHGQAGSRVCAPEIHLREETQKILQAHPVPKHYSRSTPVWLYPGKALSGSETGIRHFTSYIQDWRWSTWVLSQWFTAIDPQTFDNQYQNTDYNTFPSITVSLFVFFLTKFNSLLQWFSSVSCPTMTPQKFHNHLPPSVLPLNHSAVPQFLLVGDTNAISVLNVHLWH